MDSNDFIKSGFINVKDDNKKIGVHIYERNTLKEKWYSYNFESNVMNKIPETDIFFILGIANENSSMIHFFINKSFNCFNHSVASPTRTFLPGITDKYGVCRYMFDYKEEKILQIDTNENYYLEISIIDG